MYNRMSKEEYEELVKIAHPSSIIGGLRFANESLDRINKMLDEYLDKIKKESE